MKTSPRWCFETNIVVELTMCLYRTTFNLMARELFLCSVVRVECFYGRPLSLALIRITRVDDIKGRRANTWPESHRLIRSSLFFLKTYVNRKGSTSLLIRFYVRSRAKWDEVFSILQRATVCALSKRLSLRWIYQIKHLVLRVSYSIHYFIKPSVQTSRLDVK